VRCIVGAELLFSKGTRPFVSPPEPFKTTGPRGFPTSGDDFTGAGPIQGVHGAPSDDRSCFRRPSPPTPAPAATFDFIGHGECVDGAGHEYEHWYASDMDSLYYTNDASECGCPECERLCNEDTGCLGYSYYCCPRGVRCIVGAELLFSKGTRPSVTPPEPFKTTGPRGSPTSGDDFTGAGPIQGVHGYYVDRSCFRRPSPPSPPPAATFDFVGHGECLDGAGHQYEQWYASDLDSLYFTNDASECGCPECERLCTEDSACLGYAFYCCRFGDRCLVGAELLFSKDTRPAVTPPAPFRTTGPRGSPTSGDDFTGVGPIRGVHQEQFSDTMGGRSCYSRKQPTLLL